MGTCCQPVKRQRPSVQKLDRAPEHCRQRQVCNILPAARDWSEFTAGTNSQPRSTALPMPSRLSAGRVRPRNCLVRRTRFANNALRPTGVRHLSAIRRRLNSRDIARRWETTRVRGRAIKRSWVAFGVDCERGVGRSSVVPAWQERYRHESHCRIHDDCPFRRRLRHSAIRPNSHRHFMPLLGSGGTRSSGDPVAWAA